MYLQKIKIKLAASKGDTREGNGPEVMDKLDIEILAEKKKIS